MQEKQRAFLVRTAYWAVWTALLWLGVRYLLRWLLPFILALGLALLRERPEKTALFASLLGKLGAPRAIPALQQALDAPGIHYLDYLELRNAGEALGGDVRCERDFSGDPYYESLRRME